jgi:hypothetical protein
LCSEHHANQGQSQGLLSANKQPSLSKLLFPCPVRSKIVQCKSVRVLLSDLQWVPVQESSLGQSWGKDSSNMIMITLPIVNFSKNFQILFAFSYEFKTTTTTG